MFARRVEHGDLPDGEGILSEIGLTYQKQPITVHNVNGHLWPFSKPAPKSFLAPGGLGQNQPARAFTSKNPTPTGKPYRTANHSRPHQ
jgi:hypothetical protein